MATGNHHILGQSLMPRRQVGPWPLRAAEWADKPLACACIGGQRESTLLARCPGKRDNNMPEHADKMQAQKRRQFLCGRKHLWRNVWANQSLFFPEKDLHCDSLLCKERL